MPVHSRGVRGVLIERYYLERALLFRVPGIVKINSVAGEPYSITVYIGDENGEILPEVLEIAERVAEEIRPVTSLVAVKPYKDGPGDAVPPAAEAQEAGRTIPGEVVSPATPGSEKSICKRPWGPARGNCQNRFFGFSHEAGWFRAIC